MKCGGKREGAGRKALPDNLKKQGIYMKLSPWVKKWLKEQGKSQGAITEAALIKTYNLKTPNQ